MKPKQNQSSTHRPTSDQLYEDFEKMTGDWTEAQQLVDDYWMTQYSEELATGLRRPNPPTPEMVERAQFVDKTYIWRHARIRSGD